MNTIDKITHLRSLMREHHIDAYIIPSADNHQSEYVGDHFKARAFLTGFTGSAGTAIITKDDAGLWTDGRYFLQAEQQLAGSGIQLFKMGEPEVLSTVQYLINCLPDGGTLGFDGRVIAMEEGSNLATSLAPKNITINYHLDFIDTIWNNRPPLASEPAFALEEKYTGESTTHKLKRLRNAMSETDSNVHIITTLDDICWLLNIRGNDVAFSPLLLCYAIVTLDHVDLYIQKEKLNSAIIAQLSTDNVILHPYNQIYDDVALLLPTDTILIDPARMNYALYNNIPEHVKKIEQTNPTVLFKSMKNDIELANIKAAHIKDGVAHTKFIYWLKHQLGHVKITELSASDKLEALRAEQEGFLWPSFDPICAFKEHAAIVHYTSSADTNIELEPGHLFLTDTGGNYYEGSTDITRTIALGEINHEQKVHFTTVVRSNLNLSRTRFLYGCGGYNLDVVARQPFWDVDLNYNHGTGHGVGYLLNIHEGPAGFRWQVRPSEAHPLEEGMVITNEPGIYIANSHGVRIENELIVRKGVKNEYGQFMYFEPITFVPIDLDALLPELMAPAERDSLNQYHQQVYELIAPHLTSAEQEWLKDNTRAI